MTQQKRSIPNPNKISHTELDFISKEGASTNVIEDKGLNEKDKYKGRMISMPDSFYKQLTDYLKKHPTEGNKSSFIVRVVADYINSKLQS